MATRSETQRLVTPQQIERIHRTTDQLGLSRDSVVVPLVALIGAGRETVLPDGKLLVEAAGGVDFEPWFAGFADRLTKTDLAKVPRAKSRLAR